MYYGRDIEDINSEISTYEALTAHLRGLLDEPDDGMDVGMIEDMIATASEELDELYEEAADWWRMDDAYMRAAYERDVL